MSLPKYPTFLGNFCKGVKIFHFYTEIIFGQLFTGHTGYNHRELVVFSFITYLEHEEVRNNSFVHSHTWSFFLNGPFPASFSYFRLFYKQLTVNECLIKVADVWIEPGSSGIGSYRSANCATTTAHTLGVSARKSVF